MKILLTVGAKTQQGLILTGLANNPGWHLAKEFCGANPMIPFIGYEAPRKLRELTSRGILVNQISDRKSGGGRRFKEWMLEDGVQVSSKIVKEKRFIICFKK